MKNKIHKIITLEQLADKMDKGFKESNRRTDAKISQLDDRMDKRFERVDGRFDETNNNTDQKIDKLAIAVKHGFDEVHKRIDSLKSDMNEKFIRIDDRFRETQGEIYDLRKYLERTEKSSLEDSDAIAEEVITLKRKVENFEKKLLKANLNTAVS